MTKQLYLVSEFRNGQWQPARKMRLTWNEQYQMVRRSLVPMRVRDEFGND